MTTINPTTTTRVVDAAMRVVDFAAPVFDRGAVICITPTQFINWVWTCLDNLRFCEVDQPESPAHIEGRIKHNAVLDALAKLEPDLYADAVKRWRPLQ